MRIIVGTDVGVVKEFSVEQKKALQTFGTPTKGVQVDRMCWGRGLGDQREDEVVAAIRSGTSTRLTFLNSASFTPRLTLPADGAIKGLYMLPQPSDSGERRLLTCSESGRLTIRACPTADTAAAPLEPPPVMNLRQPVSAVRLSADWTQVAAGGKNNDLAVWDLNASKPKWAAKNVMDRTRVAEPVWVSDLHFSPRNDKQIMVSTGYGQVRLYDLAVKRVPVMKVQLTTNPLTCSAIDRDGSFMICGDAQGYVYQFDVRAGRLLGTLRGVGGSLRGIEVHADQPLVASAGLDRFVRVHNTSTRSLTCKIFAKLRMSAMLFSAEGPVRVKSKNEDEVKEVTAEDIEDDDDDDVFGQVETVGEEQEPAESSSDEEEEATKAKGTKRPVNVKTEAQEPEAFFTVQKKSKTAKHEGEREKRSNSKSQRSLALLS